MSNLPPSDFQLIPHGFAVRLCLGHMSRFICFQEASGVNSIITPATLP